MFQSPFLSGLSFGDGQQAEAGYRFYALCDKISREDISAHAYAQCPRHDKRPKRCPLRLPSN
jgi:hypothetical protein